MELNIEFIFFLFYITNVIDSVIRNEKSYRNKWVRRNLMKEKVSV